MSVMHNTIANLHQNTHEHKDVDISTYVHILFAYIYAA